ncbi:MAG: Methyltransferase type 12, partial [Bacteroidota bacterium]|nr:Methyltransferase type 12 [Bacteroidota bacterium]
MSEKKYTDIVGHYENCFDKHGDSHLGMDWPKEDDANTRYQVMLDVSKFAKTSLKSFSLLDFGCGTAHLQEYILKHNIEGVNYSGLDLSEKFVNVCRQKFPTLKFYQADLLENPEALGSFDYIVMNGVFTEKRELSFDEMFEYFQKLVTAAFAKANVGIAFNVMSKAVDWEREDLFHMPTDLLIQFVTKKLSRNFIIRNDY